MSRRGCCKCGGSLKGLQPSVEAGVVVLGYTALCFDGRLEGLLEAVDLQLQAVLYTVLLVDTGGAEGF